ncbi:MAG TPA: outer membrane protein assembly factor BamD [Candidatus Babeliaceae bacterium]|nr:outer membrane protein assembly factor BamD [Candidatus Babeliaceae bacterium]
MNYQPQRAWLFFYSFTTLVLVLLPGCNNHRTEEIVFTPVCPSLQSRKSFDRDNPLHNSLHKKSKSMTQDEAQYAYGYYRDQGDLWHACKALERLIALSTDHAITAELTLELADTYLGLKDYEKAQKLYREYRLLQPGSSVALHASYNEILAYQGDVLDTAWDQSKTQETLKVAQTFLEEFGTENPYADSVKAIIQKCYQRLLSKEIRLVHYYLTKYSYTDQASSLKAAHQRVAYIETSILNHLDYIPELSKLKLDLVQILTKLPTTAISENIKEDEAEPEVEIQQKVEPLVEPLYGNEQEMLLWQAVTLLEEFFDCPYRYYW